MLALSGAFCSLLICYAREVPLSVLHVEKEGRNLGAQKDGGIW